jgi:hypothetical protein
MMSVNNVASGDEEVRLGDPRSSFLESPTVRGNSASVDVMRDGLIRLPVTDRNGVVTSRWSRPAGTDSGGATQLPAPQLSPSSSPANGESLRIKLKEALARERPLGDKFASEDEYVVATVARSYGDDSELMHALLRNVEESDNALKDVRNAYQLLQRNGHPEPSEYMTPENIALNQRLSQVLLPRAGGTRGITLNGRQTPPAFKVEPLCCYVLTAAPEDQPLIEMLLVERKIHDVDQLTVALAELKKLARPLAEGYL